MSVVDDLEPEHILAISMFTLLGIGFCAQQMQQCGGRAARMMPVMILAALLLISVCGMVLLSSSLTTPEWAAAAGIRATD